jgi:hypothetical protein
MADLFLKLCREKFQFLVDEFEFRLVSTKTEAGVHSVIFQNQTTAVGIYYEVRDSAVWVVLMRLFQGKKGKRRLPYDGDYSHGLWAAVRLRASPEAVEEIAGEVHTETDMERILSKNAAALRMHAADILRGDFGAFPDLGRVARERRRGLDGEKHEDAQASG